MDTLVQDLRHALRTVARSPGFALAAVLTLALGIGGVTSIFSVADAVLLRPLPFAEPDRLVRVWETTPAGDPFPLSDPAYLEFRRRGRSFAETAAFSEVRSGVDLTGAGEPARLRAAAVTATLFPLLGVAPALGRTFTDAEDHPAGNRRVALVSRDVWERRFGSDPGLVGRTVVLDGVGHTVVGVMPAGFAFPASAEVWLPLAPDARRGHDEHELAVLARLRPGVTPERAAEELRGVARRLGEEHPERGAGWGARVVPMGDWIVGPQLRRTVWVLFGAVVALLLLACANVANLLLARGTARGAEIGIRSALGASRGRLVRHLFAESALLGVLGAGVGALAAVWTTQALRTFGPAGVPRLDEARVDARVLAFALAAGVLTSLASGLAPAVRASGADLHSALKRGGRGALPAGRAADALVAGGVALATLLLAGAGLLAGSLVRLQRVDPGFEPRSALVVPLQLPAARYPEERLRAFFRETSARLEGLPGVDAVGATTTNPLVQWGFSNDVTPEEQAATAPPGGLLQAGWRSVTPGFFRAMGVPLRAGRFFSAADRVGAPGVVVVSEGLARRLWPGRGAVGKRLFWGGTDGEPLTVVGVAADLRDVAVGAEPPPLVFLPYEQVPVEGMTLVVRVLGDPPAVAAAVRGEIAAVDPELPVPTVRPLADNLADATAAPRFSAVLMGLFAGAALALAAVGIYGIVSYRVAQRRREIGVRLALGARPAAVSRSVLGRGARLALAGIAAGAVAAAALTRLLAGLLYGVSPTDPATFAGAVLLLLATALLAAYLPARRAARTDPMLALRAE